MNYDVEQIKDNTELLIFNLERDIPIERIEKFDQKLDLLLKEKDIDIEYLFLQGGEVITDKELPNMLDLKELILDTVNEQERLNKLKGNELPERPKPELVKDRKNPKKQ